MVLGAVIAATWLTAGSLLAQERPSTSVQGRIVRPPAPSQDGQLRIVLYHDMEGLAGQADPRTYSFAHPDQYAYGQKLLMADVNAVIDGLFAGGADEVYVVDGHGSGNVEPDIITEELDPRAKQIFREERFGAWSGYPVLSDLVEPGEFHAVVAVGMHGKIGGGGFAAHTTTPNLLPYLNGVSITEADNLAYAWGRLGVPLIFVSGDDRLGEDIRESLPWVEYVVTKRSRNYNVIELLPVDAVRAEMRERAAIAAREWRQMHAVTLAEPIRGALETFPGATLEPLRGVPGVTFDGDKVTFVAPDFRAASEAMFALILLATRLGRAPEVRLPVPGRRGYHGAM